MKKFLLLTILILLLTAIIVSADEADDILFASSLKTHLTLNSSFDMVKETSNYKVNYVNVKLSYLPLESYRQSVISHITNPKSEENADYILFNWNNPSLETHAFSSEYIISTTSTYYPISKKVDFPITKLDNNIIPYTKSTDLIDFNDDIQSLANNLAQGEDDLYKIVFDAALWVNNNIKYDLSTATAEASLPSSWVLKNRKGVCDEMTNLFISILRSLGIPAKFVSGISYTNSEKFAKPWGPHGWAEVYFPNYGWVPFDPTYGQYGYVDAGHIKLKENIDSDKSSVDFEWLSYGVSIKGKTPENSVEVLEHSDKVKSDMNINVKALESNVGFGSYDVLIIKVKNNAPEYRTTKLNILKTPDVKVSEQSKVILLKPNELKTVLWKVKFPDNLNKTTTYRFPFMIGDNFNNSYSKEIVLTSRDVVLNEDFVDAYILSNLADKDVLDVDIKCDNKDSIKVGEELKINCEINKFENIDACYESQCQKLDSNTFNFTKTFKTVGVYPLAINIRQGIKEKNFYGKVLVMDNPNISVKWENPNQTINYKNSQRLSFVLSATSLANPKNLQILLEYNNHISKISVENLDVSQIIQFVVNGNELDIGKNEIKLNITYSDEYGKIYSKESSTIVTMQTSSLLELILAKINKFVYFLNSLFM